MCKIKGEVVHRGKIVPVEVEVGIGWLGVNAIKVHIPSSYKYANDLTHMIDFRHDLESSVRPYSEEENVGTGYCEDKICKIVNSKFCWILEVDGFSVPFQNGSNADYFEDHYRSMGYKIIREEPSPEEEKRANPY